MAVIANQNSISDIVRANVTLTANIVQIITGISSSVNTILSTVNNFKQTMDAIYGNDGTGGMMGQITQINENLDDNKLRLNPYRRKLIDFHFAEIYNILNHMRKLGRGTWFMKDERIQRATTVINYLKDINETLDSISFNPLLSIKIETLAINLNVLNKDVIPVIRNMSIKALLVSEKGLNKITNNIFPFLTNLFELLNQYKFSQLFFLKKKIQSLSEVITSLEDVINELLRFSLRVFWKGLFGNVQFKIIKNIFTNIQSIIEFVDDMDMIDTTSRKFKLLSKYVTYIYRITHKTLTRMNGESYNVWNLVITSVKLSFIVVIFEKLHDILYSVQKSRTFLLTGKLKAISKNLYDLFNIVDDIRELVKLFGITELIVIVIKMSLIKKIFGILAGVIALATLAALVSVPFLILAIPFAAAMIWMCTIIEVLITYARSISIKDIIRLTLLISIITLISLVGVSMLVLALTAQTVMQNYKWIILFIVGLIPVVLLIMLIGILTIKIAILAAPCIIGMFAMVAMIAAIVLVALQLKWLEKIQLDRQTIMYNIDTVMAVAKSIIYSLFMSDDAQADLDKAGGSKSWFGAFMGIFVSNKIMLQAILSAGIMALTLISVTMIMIMVLELKVLAKQAMSLDKNKVLNSVDKVLSTAKFLGSCVFGGKYYDENENKVMTNYDHDQKTWLGKMFSGIGTILNTICSSAIMMMSFMSISMIWLMAKELANLQKIQLDRNAIATNIDKIITTAKMVIDIVNAPSPTKEKNKKDGIIGKLLDFVLPSNMKYMIDAISTMGFTAITMIAIGIICKIGKQLTKIQELPTLDKVQSNTQMLMDTCKQVIQIVDNQDMTAKDIAKHIRMVRNIKRLINNIVGVLEIDTKEDKLSGSIDELIISTNYVITKLNDLEVGVIKSERLDRVTEMFRGVKTLVKLTNSIENISINKKDYIDFIQAIDDIMVKLNPEGVGILHAGKGLRFNKQIKIFNELTNLIKNTVEHVNPGDVTNIVKERNAYLLLIGMINDISYSLMPKRVGGWKRFKLDSQLKAFSSLTSYINHHQSDILTASQIMFMQYKDTGYAKFIEILKETCDDIMKLIDIHKPNYVINYANKLNKLIESFSQNSNRVDLNKLKETTGIYINFLDKINTIKVENLEKSTQMFKQMAQFSKSINGNFDSLAESLNEKLMPVLEELKDIMEKVPGSLDKGFANTSRSIISTSQSPISQSTMAQQVQMENPNISKEDLDRIVKTRLNEQARMQSNSIVSKVDELIELLSTGKVKVETV